MNKSLYLVIFIAIFLIAGYALKLRPITQGSSRQFSFNVPKIPSIKRTLKDKTDIGNFSVWGINRAVGQAASAYQKGPINENGEYSYKKFNGIPAIYRVKNENYRWEFYGTVLRSGHLLAIFYNPALKKNKTEVVKRGGLIDINLRIKQLSNNKVTIEYDTESSFILKIFNIDEKRIRRKIL